MAFHYKLHKEALEEYIDAYEWYENELKGLGEKFSDAVDKRVAQICENPGYYSYVHGFYRQVGVEGFHIQLCINFFQNVNWFIFLQYTTAAEIQRQNSGKKYS